MHGEVTVNGQEWYEFFQWLKANPQYKSLKPREALMFYIQEKRQLKDLEKELNR